MSSIRLERLSHLIQQETSAILKKEVSDPRIGFVSITDVEVSPDIKHVRIHVSCMGTKEEQAQSMKGLASATAFIRGKLGRKLDLRFTPEIVFSQDQSLERGSRVIALMNKLNTESKHVQKTVRKNKKGS